MKLEQCMQATNTIHEIARSASAMPENQTNAAVMASYLQIAAIYLADYSRHLADGKDSYDALLAAADGDTELDERKTFLLRLMDPLNARDTDSNNVT